MDYDMKVLISGGGTGGHIFPAVSIANALREKHPDCEILFVGAESRMEMERVPAAGYNIVGLPIRGFDRAHVLKNIGVLVDLFKSMRKAKKIVKEFKPDVAVGVGGYASGAAGQSGIELSQRRHDSGAAGQPASADRPVRRDEGQRRILLVHCPRSSMAGLLRRHRRHALSRRWQSAFFARYRSRRHPPRHRPLSRPHERSRPPVGHWPLNTLSQAERSGD